MKFKQIYPLLCFVSAIALFTFISSDLNMKIFAGTIGVLQAVFGIYGMLVIEDIIAYEKGPSRQPAKPLFDDRIFIILCWFGGIILFSTETPILSHLVVSYVLGGAQIIAAFFVPMWRRLKNKGIKKIEASS